VNVAASTVESIIRLQLNGTKRMLRVAFSADIEQVGDFENVA
jgi:hypothetical protein